jgi:DNA gyrase/topoisomerase IV subunit B
VVESGESSLRLFDLNIEKVLEGWEVYHAVREVIANALDEKLLTRTTEIEIFKDKQGQWHIRDFGRGLKYQHLTQNENEEKLATPNLVIGKFRVGLKDQDLKRWYENTPRVKDNC